MKQLIEDYQRKIDTLTEQLACFKSTGSINDIKKVERLTTKLNEYRAFVTELERALSASTNVQPDTFEDAIPDIGERIDTVGALKAFLNTLKNDDQVIMETIDLQTGDVEDLFPFHMDVIDGIELTDGRTISEIRFCQETNIPEELRAMYAKGLRQSDETPQLISKIDFTTLRTQKKTLIEMIDDMEKKNAEYYKDDVSNLSGILNLIDSLQDFAVDVMGLNPINVFDFELEESREDVTKTITLCKECNTDDVTIKVKNSGYCMICGKEVETYKATLKADAKVIGYQVLGMASHENDGQLHPEMSASFCLYSLKQARKMLSSDNTMYTNEWVIVSIWSGDIEEPTFMFHGNPDNNHKK